MIFLALQPRHATDIRFLFAGTSSTFWSRGGRTSSLTSGTSLLRLVDDEEEEDRLREPVGCFETTADDEVGGFGCDSDCGGSESDCTGVCGSGWVSNEP